MKLPLSWLKEYVDIGDVTVEELTEKLVNVGFEVEEVIRLGEDIVNVVTGKIISTSKHPNADKLRICETDVGGKTVTIVTGAPNGDVGDVVPVGLDGATLPGGKKIIASELRGVRSSGMFCSGSELNIDNSVIEGAEVYGLLILPSDTPLGVDICDLLGLKETVFDISVTSNRPDCQSIFGIAREVATVLGKQVKSPSLEYKVYNSSLKIPAVKAEDEYACGRYTGRLITDVKIQPSPKWMRDRLRYVGIRAINNVVDVTNYVLAEIGQPLHAFDINNVEGSISVRYAKEGETIVALDGKKYDLHTNNLLIADDVKPIAIAGVMGGEYSGINPDTTTVFLEAAKFAKDTVRSSSRELGLRSDSSSRYEKGVDFYSIEAGRERALALFDELGVGKVTSLSVSAGKEVPKERILTTTTTKICDLIGINISAEIMVEILNNLGIKTFLDGKNMSCVIPLYREDIDNYTDLAEEVIRYYGYDNIKSTFIKNAHPTVGGTSTRAKNVEKVKDVLVSYGAYEALTYSFISQKAYDTLRFASDDPIRNTIRILNPLSEEFTVMRTQLVSSMLDSVYTNFSRKNDDFRLFEIGKVYIPKSLPLTELPQEIETLCFALVGKNEDFYAAKEIATEVFKTLGATCDIKRSAAPYLHPGISADFINEGKVVGSVGKVHPLVAEKYKIDQNVIIATITLEDFVNCDEKAVKYAPLPKFPVVERDLAVTVNVDVPVGNMIKVIKQNMGSYCAGVVLFDVYTGEQVEAGKKSVAFSIKINPGEKTLIDAQIQDIMNGILAALNEEFDAKIRA